MKKKQSQSTKRSKTDNHGSPPEPLALAPTAYELATLAARINPDLCQQTPEKAANALPDVL